jgi:hypothetical protein
MRLGTHPGGLVFLEGEDVKGEGILPRRKKNLKSGGMGG